MNYENHITREEVDQAWQLRIDAKFDAALSLLSNLRQRAPILREKIDEIVLNKIIESDRAELLLDLILLHASFARADKREEEFQRIICIIDKKTQEYSIPRPFWLLFEQAMFVYRRGDSSNALENFTLAYEKARNPFEKLVSRINIACCLHNLGQSYEKPLKEINSLLDGIKEKNHLTLYFQQKAVLDFYELFRKGEFAKIAKQEVVSGSQGDFLKLWWSQLPYHRFHKTCDSGIESFSEHSSSCIEHGYRQRTLLGLLHPADEEITRLSDWADRLYLWVWRWLVSPSSFPIERVLATLAPLKQNSKLYLLSVEDRKLVRNALLWLGLFDSSSRRSIQSLLKMIEVPGISHYPFVEMEKLLIFYWMSVRDNEQEKASDYFTQLEKNPFFQSSDLYFNQLFETHLKSSHPLFAFSQRLSKFKTESLERSRGMVIDFETFQVINRTTKKEAISEPIVQALACLKLNGVATFQQVAACAFGISSFDPLIHNAKIYNLVSRMKVVFTPFLYFKTKNLKIYTTGDWKHIQFRSESSPERNLFTYPHWREIIYERIPSERTTQPVPLSLIPEFSDTPLSRAQLQKLCGKSRATTGRFLQSWHKKGWVKKTGNARATRYRLSSFLQKEIKEGRLTL